MFSEKTSIRYLAHNSPSSDCQMDELNKFHGNYILPLAAVVSTTPPETDQAAKKEEERVPFIFNPDDLCLSKEHKVDVNDSSWIKTVRKKLNSVRPQPYPSSRPWTIFRVPENIRIGDSKAYAPLVVSIGPYHFRHAQRGTHVAMQDHKWQCVRHLLSRHRSRERATELLDRCLLELKALDCEVRSCYSRNLNFDQNKLASIMLLDGCFIIHILLKQLVNENRMMVTVEERRREEGMEKQKEKEMREEEEEIVELDIGDEEENIEGPLLGMLWIWNLILYDLLKVENQIPFFVIQTLFDFLKTGADEGIDLANLALKLFHDIHPNKSKTFTAMPRNKIHHLLHLFHSTLTPSQPTLVLAEQVNITTSPEWIPCATDLKFAGIKFKKNEAAQSFLDVSFKDGVMEIPPLRIYDYTPSLFRNLIAFEQCYPDTRTYVTIYAAFMDSIIDSANDVKLLDLKGILVNRLSTDEAVADLFNKLCNQIHYASDRNYLADVFVKVKRYHESTWHIWRAGLIRDYFNNPWAGIAVVAAVVLFLLTIEQSIFAALSYFCPP